MNAMDFLYRILLEGRMKRIAGHKKEGGTVSNNVFTKKKNLYFKKDVCSLGQVVCSFRNFPTQCLPYPTAQEQTPTTKTKLTNFRQKTRVRE